MLLCIKKMASKNIVLGIFISKKIGELCMTYATTKVINI